PGGQAEPEVKYAFAREHWGQGLATEAVRGVVAYARSAHGMTRLIATTAPQNAASHRVLEKSGFVRGELRENEDGSHTQSFEWRAGRGGPARPATPRRTGVPLTMPRRSPPAPATRAGACAGR